MRRYSFLPCYRCVVYMWADRLLRLCFRCWLQALGRVLRVTTGFSFPSNDAFLSGNIRVKKELEPLGCLGDLGWCVHACLIGR